MKKKNKYNWLFTDNKILNFFIFFDFFNILKKYNKRTLIRLLRSYNSFKKSKNLSFLDELEHDIENIDFKINNTNFYKTLGGINIKISNKILHQLISKFLSRKIGFMSISKSILLNEYFKSSLIYPYPQAILIKINKKIKVNFFLSSLCFIFVKFLFFLYGLKACFQIFINSIHYFFIKNKYKQDSIYFFNLSNDNFINIENHSIFSWFVENKRINVNNIYHNSKNYKKLNFNNINIQYREHIYLNSFVSLFSFLTWLIIYIPIYLILTFFGKWHFPIMFNEVVKAKAVEYSNHYSEAYYFNNSNFVFRPLWTYILERKGSEIIFYFYSNNNDRILTKQNKFFPPAYWYNTTWNHYYVWNKYNKKFLETYTINKKKFTKTGPIWFGDKTKEIKIEQKKFITVFDISPSRPLFYKSLFFSDNYILFENTKNFLNDIYNICEKENIYVCFKLKRNFTNIHDKRYINLIKNFKRNKKFFIPINPSTSAFSLIKISKAIISFPFTSTNFIANEFGITNTYYDPSSLILSSKKTQQSLNIINNKEELKSWIEKIIF